MDSIVKKLISGFSRESALNVFSRHAEVSRSISSQISSLRGLSALVVLIAHANQIIISPTNHTLYAVAGLFAQAAVMVFFVLSGFLICKSITRNVKNNNDFYLRSYLIDRADRITPPFIFSIGLTIIFFLLAPYFFLSKNNSFQFYNEFIARPGFYVDFWSVIGTLCFLNGFLTKTISANGPLWSLSYEVWYYLIAGLIVSARTYKLVMLCICLIVVLSVLNQAFFIYSIVWISGAVIAVFHNWNIKKLNQVKILIMIFISISLATAIFYLYEFSHVSLKQIDSRIIVFYNLILGVAFSMILHMIVNNYFTITSLFCRVGDFSYTLYLIHFPVLLFAYGALQEYIHKELILTLIITFLMLLACTLLAYHSAYKIERMKPFRKIFATLKNEVTYS